MLHILLVLFVIYQTPTPILTEAETLMQEGRYAEAVDAYTQILSRDPADVEAYLGRGAALMASGKLDEALADYEQVIVYAPFQLEGYARRAAIFASRLDYETARVEINRYIRLNPEAAEGYAARADYYDEVSGYPDAYGDLSFAIELEPENPLWYARRATLTSAFSGFAQDPDQRVFLCIRMGSDLDEALALAGSSSDIDASTLATWYRERAQAALCLGDSASALDDFSAAIDLAPSSSLYRARANLEEAQGDYEAAIADVTSALALLPNDHTLLVERAQLLEDSGQYDAALADYTTVYEMTEWPDILVARGRVYSNQGDFDAALDDLNAAVAAEVEGALLTRAVTHERRGDTASAAQDYYAWIIAENFELIPGALQTDGTDQLLLVEEYRAHALTFEGGAGQVLNVANNDSGETFDSLLIVLGPNGDAIAAADDNAGGLKAEIFDFVLPDDGTYTLILTHSGGIGSTWLTIRGTLAPAP